MLEVVIINMILAKAEYRSHPRTIKTVFTRDVLPARVY